MKTSPANVRVEPLEPRQLMSASPTVIARWDAVPDQTFGTELDVGVVAFHASGIDRVDFSVNGGPATSVRQMTLNPQTKVWEYVLPLHAADYGDGPVQVTATAYSAGAGQPRVLPALTQYADANGSLPSQTRYVSPAGSDSAGDGSAGSPFASIERATESASDGAFIDLAAGTYDFTGRQVGWDHNSRWITIQPAPGVARLQVVVRPDGQALRVDHLALENVTVQCTVGADLSGWNYGENADDALWVDGCDVTSPLGQVAASEIAQPIDAASWSAKYVTNTAIHDYPGRGMVGIDLARGDSLYNLGDDSIDNPGLLVNTRIDNVVADNPADHIDGVQWWNGGTNDADSIVYGVRAARVDGQLLFGQDVSNVAVVNFLGTSLQGGVASPAASQWGRGTLDHLVFDHVTLPNQSFYLSDDDPNTQLSDVAVRNSVFWRLFATNPATGTIADSHVIDASKFRPGFGGYTSGDPGFNNPAAGDYSPAAGSVLLGRVGLPDVPSDVFGNVRAASDAIGAVAFAAPASGTDSSPTPAVTPPTSPLVTTSPRPFVSPQFPTIDLGAVVPNGCVSDSGVLTAGSGDLLYRFVVAADSTVTVKLLRQKGAAKFELEDSAGDVLRPFAAKSVRQTLAAGTYYVDVAPPVRRMSRFHLTVASKVSVAHQRVRHARVA